MKTSDTPRTDAECGWYDPNGIRYPDPTGDHVDPDFARDMERELAAAKERIRRLERSLDMCDPRFSGFCRTVWQGQAMSDTPRTNLNHLTVETLRTLKGTGTKIVLASVSSQLERELADANERIRRLEKAAREVYLDSIASDHQWSTLEASHMNALREVLEAKP